MNPHLQQAIEQIAAARDYTSKILDAIDPADWYRVPPAGVSHIAWQVGHLAMAEYRLVLERVRGRQPGDERLISETLLRQFGRESVPEAEGPGSPSAGELRHVFDQVHTQAMHELPGLTEEELGEPALRPHVLFTTRLGGLLWCSRHEMLHAGQIGLLRRQLGRTPLW